jgi:hypothetical protein
MAQTHDVAISSQPPAIDLARTGAKLPAVRGRLRFLSAFVMLAFVAGHLIDHSLPLVSLKLAEVALQTFLTPWHTSVGFAGLRIVREAITYPLPP